VLRLHLLRTGWRIFDPAQSLADFKDFMVFFKQGDIVRFTPVTEVEYNDIQRRAPGLSGPGCS